MLTVQQDLSLAGNRWHDSLNEEGYLAPVKPEVVVSREESHRLIVIRRAGHYVPGYASPVPHHCPAEEFGE